MFNHSFDKIIYDINFKMYYCTLKSASSLILSGELFMLRLDNKYFCFISGLFLFFGKYIFAMFSDI